MIVYFADRRFNILGAAATDLPGVPLLLEDKEMSELASGVSTFEGIVFAEEKKEQKPAAEYVSAGNYLLYQSETGAGKFYTIMSREIDRKSGEIYFYAEDAGLDLINEVVGPKSAPSTAQPITYYINQATADSGFIIGRNEVADLKRTLKWEGSATATKRLASIANSFDNAELYYNFKIVNMRVTKKYINVVRKRGEDNGLELRLDRDINNIVASESIENLATALYVSGGTPEGAEEPITLAGFAYDDGRFYTEGPYLKDRESVKKWSRYLTESGNDAGHIVDMYSYDTLSKSELCNRAVSRLRAISEVESTYEVELSHLPENVNVGDVVRIVDDNMHLYLSARIEKLTRSRGTKKITAVFGSYKRVGSGINAKLQALADKVASIQDGKDSAVGYLTNESAVITSDKDGNNIESYDPASGIFKVVQGKTEVAPEKVLFAVAENAGCDARIDRTGGYSISNMVQDTASITFTATYGDLILAKTLVVAKSKTGDDGKSPLLLTIASTNGNIFKNGDIETTLSATVTEGVEDVTARYDANQFIWTRKSKDTDGDQTWNNAHYGGAKSITITTADVFAKATFFCDLIDTVTRRSLL